jgi:hypothetical protein
MRTLSADNSHPLVAAAFFLADQQRPEASPHFWATVLRCVLVGQLDGALEVMLLHPAYAARDAPAAKQQVRRRIHAQARSGSVHPASWLLPCMCSRVPGVAERSIVTEQRQTETV